MIFLRSEMVCIGLGDLGVMYRDGIIGALFGVLGLIPYFGFCGIVCIAWCWDEYVGATPYCV